jgi:D-inositol-3-phosphate glycosyltransferase
VTSTPAIADGGALRVLLVCHYFPPHVGGIERVVRDEATRLVRQGHEVAVLTSGERSGVETVDGVRVVRVAAWNIAERKAGVPFPLFSPSLAFQALRWAGWADVIHVHDCFYLSSWSAGLASVLRRRPMVLTQHVAMVDHPSAAVQAVQKLVYGTAGRMLLRRARNVFTLNGHVTELVTRLGAASDKVEVLANGVDGEFYRPSSGAQERALIRKRFGLPLDRVLVLYVGRLVPKKGIGLVLEAADPGYDVVVVGTGDERAVREVQARSAVHHLGGRPAEEVAELYRACDVFALPSTGEGFPLVIQEAMSSGMPVVTSDDPAYAPYGLERAGVALIRRDTEALRTALVTMAADDAERARLSRQAASYAEERFSWAKHVETLLGRYRAVARSTR